MLNHPIPKIVCILATLLAAQGALAQPAQMQPENTYAVIVGVLEWESTTLSSFSKKNRRDQGLYDQLKIIGVPEENMVLLLGKEATNANMLKATKAVAQRAGKDSTIIFYYAGHGYPGSKGIYFASYDAGADEQVLEGFLINDVARILKDDYKGERVLLMADCCYSGGLADVAYELSKSGFKTASLTSASIANTSSGRWTFTCSIIDALSGRRLLDLDSDGYIAISEAGDDVKEAMNIVESQNHGFALHGMGKSFRLSQVSPDEPQARPIPKPYVLGQRMRLRDGRRRSTARIVDYKDGKLRLEIQRYHDRKFVWRAADELSVAEKPSLRVVPASSQEFPLPLSPEVAGKKATVNGKYSNLLKKITVKFDYLSYGPFSDYGRWKSETYGGYSDLPEGYWVYVYPNWYIFEKKADPLDRSRADVKLSPVFGDHMVIQQEQTIRVFGWAEPGEKVTAEMAGKTASDTAREDGYFRIELPSMKADGESHTMTVAGKNTIELNDVLLGEVWICSGQSNMEWSVGKALNAKEEIAAANHPHIRLFNVPGHVAGPIPLDDPRGQWQTCSPKTIGGFSAVGYYFGRSLQETLDVPIGLVGTNWGGTRIEPWTPPIGFRHVPSLKDYVENLTAIDPATPIGKANHQEFLTSVDNWLKQAQLSVEAGKGFSNPPQINLQPKGGATHIYNGMVHGLIPLSVRGAIWYQGESNADDGLRYEYLKEALVKGWRTVFENEDMSFYWVQLANFRRPDDDPAGGGWGPIREGQRRALRIPNTGMAVIIDIGNARDIHPKNKQDVGARLALWALAKNYGREIAYSGPLYKSMQVEGNKIRIAFDHVGDGLITGKKEGLKPTEEITDAELTQFAIQAGDGKWHWAKAKIDGPTIVVWADGVSDPKHVRFGYQSNPVRLNLYNKAGLPASPFTTD